MKRFLIVPALLICLTGSTSKQSQVTRSNTKFNEPYRPDLKVKQLDSLMKKL